MENDGKLTNLREACWGCSAAAWTNAGNDLPKNPFCSLRGPAIALHQWATKASESSKIIHFFISRREVWTYFQWSPVEIIAFLNVVGEPMLGIKSTR